MKAYGIPRLKDVEHPDCVDIARFALKSCIGHVRKKGGEYKNSLRKAVTKAATRRIWKKRARKAGQKDCVIDK